MSPAGERPAPGGEGRQAESWECEGALRTPNLVQRSARPLPPSCSRPTASSTGGSRSMTSVSGGVRAWPSSRCRLASPPPTWGAPPLGCQFFQQPPLAVGRPLFLRVPAAHSRWVLESNLALSRAWGPPLGHQGCRGASGQAPAGGPEGREGAGPGQAGASGADPGGWVGLGWGWRWEGPLGGIWAAPHLHPHSGGGGAWAEVPGQRAPRRADEGCG